MINSESQEDKWLICMGLSVSEHGAVYEVKLVAYNGNGESDCSKRLVSLAEEGVSEQSTGECVIGRVLKQVHLLWLIIICNSKHIHEFSTYTHLMVQTCSVRL